MEQKELKSILEDIKLKPLEENFNVDNNNKELFEIHPLLPTKYSRVKREELKKFEQELLKGVRLDI